MTLKISDSHKTVYMTMIYEKENYEYRKSNHIGPAQKKVASRGKESDF